MEKVMNLWNRKIVYYVDPATPVKWREYLIQGVDDWQVAFEAAGFKNAIIGKFNKKIQNSAPKMCAIR